MPSCTCRGAVVPGVRADHHQSTATPAPGGTPDSRRPRSPWCGWRSRRALRPCRTVAMRSMRCLRARTTGNASAGADQARAPAPGRSRSSRKALGTSRPSRAPIGSVVEARDRLDGTRLLGPHRRPRVAAPPRPGAGAVVAVVGRRGAGAAGAGASLAASADCSRTIPRTTSLMRTIRTPRPCP